MVEILVTLIICLTVIVVAGFCTIAGIYSMTTENEKQ